MDEKVIPHLVARFLSWKLPPDFSPDAGISFVPEYSNGTPEGGRHEPSGTNLLNAEQAFAMFRHVLEHPAVSAMPDAALLREALSALEPFASAAERVDAGPDLEPDGVIVGIAQAKSGRGLPYTLNIGNIRRARAAANKIRAALGEE